MSWKQELIETLIGFIIFGGIVGLVWILWRSAG